MTAGLWQNWVLPGIWITVQLTVCSAALAAAVAFGVGMARTHRSRFVRFLAGFYTEVFRGTSALVLMFWLFFVLPRCWAGSWCRCGRRCSRWACRTGRTAPRSCAVR